MNIIYIVTETTGEYSSANDNPLCWFERESDANAYAAARNAASKPEKYDYVAASYSVAAVPRGPVAP